MPLSPAQRQTMLWIAIGLGFGVLLWLLGPVLLPFVLGAVLAYMLAPGVERLTRHRVPRVLAVLVMIVVVCVIFTLLLLLIVPVLSRELVLLQQKLPGIVDVANATLAPRLHAWFGLDLQLDAATAKEFIADKVADQNLQSRIIAALRTGTGAVIGVLALATLVPVVLFFLLLDGPEFGERALRLVPRPVEPQVKGFLREIDALLSQFLRGQISVMLALAVYYSVALSIARFDVALPVGIVTGLLVFIPYLGFGLGLLLALLAAMLQFSDLHGLIAVAVIYGTGQVLEGFFLTPKLVGKSIGLHPLAVIFALMAFGQLFGFVGILVALPVSAVLLVAMRHVMHRYFASRMYTG